MRAKTRQLQFKAVICVTVDEQQVRFEMAFAEPTPIANELMVSEGLREWLVDSQ